MPDAVPPETVHLKPAARLASRVLLCGDPHRSLAIAQHFLRSPQMFNTRRGLWGYTGLASDGDYVTIQSTGMGAPSAAIVVEELISLGATHFIRLGTCGALAGELALGQLVTVERVIAADGASRALGPIESLVPDRELTDALEAASRTRRVTAVSNDLFYAEDHRRIESWISAGAEVIEMEAAILVAVTQRHGLGGACMLAVSDAFDARGAHTRLDAHGLEQAGRSLGQAGLAALCGGSQEPEVTP